MPPGGNRTIASCRFIKRQKHHGMTLEAPTMTGSMSAGGIDFADVGLISMNVLLLQNTYGNDKIHPARGMCTADGQVHHRTSPAAATLYWQGMTQDSLVRNRPAGHARLSIFSPCILLH